MHINVLESLFILYHDQVQIGILVVTVRWHLATLFLKGTTTPIEHDLDLHNPIFNDGKPGTNRDKLIIYETSGKQISWICSTDF